MRIVLVGLVLGCGNGNGSAVDAKTDPAVCRSEREAAIDRTCTVPADCALVASADCCGTVMIAVKSGTQAGYPSVEATYQSCLDCPPTGCNHADLAEDGATPMGGQTIVAACNAGRCASIVQ